MTTSVVVEASDVQLSASNTASLMGSLKITRESDPECTKKTACIAVAITIGVLFGAGVLTGVAMLLKFVIEKCDGPDYDCSYDFYSSIEPGR